MMPEVNIMPTKTFWNLSESKREKILKASIKEFSSTTFDKVSINQIIKDAEISRGSFYMYFDDIYDLAIYLVQSTKKEVLEELKSRNIIKSNKLEDILIATHSVVFDYYYKETYQQLFKNIIVYFQSRPEEELETVKTRIPQDEDVADLLKLIDRSEFTDNSDDFVRTVIELAMVIFRNSLMKTFIFKLDKEESKELLEKNLDLLKNGYTRRK